MHAKIFLTFITLFLITSSGFSQEIELNFFQNKAVFFSVGAAKLENGSPLIHTERAPQFSLRYRLYRDNLHFNQISINDFWTKDFDTPEFAVKAWQIGLEYAYGAKLFRLGNNATFYIGGTAGLEYFNSDASSLSSNFFSTKMEYYALLTGGFAELQCQVFQNLIFYIHFPVGVIQLSVDSTEIDNPNISERQRQQGGLHLDVKHNFGIELGVGWRF